MLKIVKAQNSSLSHKEAQELASSKYKELKEKLAKTGSSFTDQKVKEDISGMKAGDKVETDTKEIGFPELMAAEKKIRANVVDINRLIVMGKQVIPDGEIVKHGKSGVNTLVTFEDKFGNKLPVKGYFIIYI